MRRAHLSIALAVAVLVAAGIGVTGRDQAAPAARAAPICSGCPSPFVYHPVTAAGLAALRARPLRLPPLDPTLGCPISRPHLLVRSQVTGSALGYGAFYLIPYPTTGGPEQAAFLLGSPTYAGPILVRAAAVGGAGYVSLDASGGQSVTPGATPGTLMLPAWIGPGPPAGNPWLLSVQAGGAGCYALQMDALGFPAEVVVFTIP